MSVLIVLLNNQYYCEFVVELCAVVFLDDIG